MRPRQSVWKWLLAGLIVVIAAGLAVFLLRPAGPPSDISGRVEASLSEWTGGTVRLSEPVRLRYLPPSLEGSLTLSDAANLPSVQSLDAPKFRLTLSLPDLLMGNIAFRSLRLDEPTLELKAGEQARTAEAVLGRLTAFLAEAPLETVRINRGAVESADGRRALRRLDLRLNTRGQLGVLGAVGSFTFKGEKVTFSLDRGKTTEVDTGHSTPLTLKVTSVPLTARFSGTMQVGEELAGSGDLEATLPDIRHFLSWVGIALPDGTSLKNASASGRVHWAGPTLTFDDGSFEFDGNEAVGLLAITAGGRPRIDGTLAFETLTLDPYLPDDWPTAQDDPLLDWLLFKHIDADLRLSTAELAAGAMQFGSGGFTINAKKRAISSEIGALELCGGHAEGRLDLDLSAPRLQAVLIGSLADIEMDACLESLGVGVPLAGAGTVKIDIATSGKSYAELVRGLTGTTVATAKDGTLPIDLTTLGSEPGAQVSGWSKQGNAAFSEIAVECRLSAGYLWCQSFRMKTDEKLLSGSGGLDISRQTLDWDLRMADPEAALDSGEGVAESQPEITIKGALTAPQMARSGSPEPAVSPPEPDTERP